MAQENLQDAQRRQKLQSDELQSQEPSFEVGNEVLLSIQLENPGSRKLLPLWVAPLRVVAKVEKLAEGMMFSM